MCWKILSSSGSTAKKMTSQIVKRMKNFMKMEVNLNFLKVIQT